MAMATTYAPLPAAEHGEIGPRAEKLHHVACGEQRAHAIAQYRIDGIDAAQRLGIAVKYRDIGAHAARLLHRIQKTQPVFKFTAQSVAPRSCMALKKAITADLRRHIDHFPAGVAARFERSEHLSAHSGASGNPDRGHPLLRF
jgi:hypothetical protein